MWEEYPSDSGPWEHTDQELWVAYTEGYHAGQWGDPKSANPYSDAPLRQAWRIGWAEGSLTENDHDTH